LLIVVRDRSGSIATRLRSYDEAEEETSGPGSLVQTGFLTRAVDMTGRLATDSGLLAKTEAMLEQANIALRPAEALFFYAAGVVVLGLLVMVAAPSMAVALILLALLIAAPPLALKRMQSSRFRKFETQLPDMLQLLGGSLRAGYSLLQGLEAVSQETPEPMGREMRRVLAEARLGRSLEDALQDTAERMKSRDFDWAVMAINIQREVGGNLAELLQTVGETMTSRERIRREIKALTAEGRISALVMGLLPIGLAGFLFAVSPDYIGTLFHTGMGLVAVTGSALLAGGGLVWLNKIIKIEV
jgi:tight adherence protein B